MIDFSGAFAIAARGGIWDSSHVQQGIQLMIVGGVTRVGISTESALPTVALDSDATPWAVVMEGTMLSATRTTTTR